MALKNFIQQALLTFLPLFCLAAPIVAHVVDEQGDTATLRNDSRTFRTSPEAQLTGWINTSSYVLHMEPDLHIPGNVIFSDSYSIKTTDGRTTTTIVGSTSSGYTEGVGTVARFNWISGFRQLSSNVVLVVDYNNHCLRFVYRHTRQTSPYVGYCGSSGFTNAGYSSARFKYPWAVIDDIKRPGYVIVTDNSNHALRHVSKVGGFVSSIYSSSSAMNYPRGITQDPLSGDLYVTLRHRIARFLYNSKSFHSYIGSTSSGFQNCDFSSTLFRSPYDVLQISENKAIVADKSNHRLRILDYSTSKSSSICTGSSSHGDGGMNTCSIYLPTSLMVLNDTLFVGGHRQISKIPSVNKLKDLCTADDPITKVISSTSTSNLAAVDLTLTDSNVRLNLPHGNFTVDITSETVSCSKQIQVIDRTKVKCNHSSLVTVVTSPETGLATVDLPDDAGQMRLPHGGYTYQLISDTDNCTVNVKVIDHKIHYCTNDAIRVSASAETGLGDVSLPGAIGDLTLPIGSYAFQLDQNCSMAVEVVDSLLKQRVVIRARYHAKCESLSDASSQAALNIVSLYNKHQIDEICDNDCSPALGEKIDIQCNDTTLEITWPTNLVYSGKVGQIPSDVETRITRRLADRSSYLYIFILSHNPPVIYPITTDDGGSAELSLLKFCDGDAVYDEDTRRCQIPARSTTDASV